MAEPRVFRNLACPGGPAVPGERKARPMPRRCRWYGVTLLAAVLPLGGCASSRPEPAACAAALGPSAPPVRAEADSLRGKGVETKLAITQAPDKPGRAAEGASPDRARPGDAGPAQTARQLAAMYER